MTRRGKASGQRAVNNDGPMLSGYELFVDGCKKEVNLKSRRPPRRDLASTHGSPQRRGF